MGAGEYSSRFVPDNNVYIIAADAGFKTLNDRGIEPDLVVGDFDSLDVIPDHPNILRVPAEKNDTDMSLAIKQGLSNGVKVFIIDGGLSGRLDHTIANIQLLKKINQSKAHGLLLGKDVCITTITGESVTLEADAGSIISVFTIGNKAEGVTLEGLKYPLSNYTMTDSYPIGVSNEFTGQPAVITVKQGTLMITSTGIPVTITFDDLTSIRV